MSIEAIRFRVGDGGLVVLQVATRSRGSYAMDRDPEWRDAKVEDLLEVAAFTRNAAQVENRLQRLEAAAFAIPSHPEATL